MKIKLNNSNNRKKEFALKNAENLNEIDAAFKKFTSLKKQRINNKYGNLFFLKLNRSKQ